MTTQEMESMLTTVKSATDAIKAAQETQSAGEQERVKKMVEETLKSVLRNHPGVTHQRSIQFNDDKLFSPDQDLLTQVPKEVQDEMDKVYIMSQILNVHPKGLKRYGHYRKLFEARANDVMKALDSTTAGGVDEWVPTEMTPSLVEKIRLQLKVAALFGVIPMSSNPYQLPVEVGNIMSFGVDEVTADTGGTEIPVGDTTNLSERTTFTAKGHKTRVLTSKEATEDSIVPLLPYIQNRIVLALAQGREDLILNGDTASPHEDTDTTSATSRRKKWLGLRAMANDQSFVTDLATLTFSNVLGMRGNMGVYGVNPADLAIVTSIAGFIKMLKEITETTTVDKFGPNAVILSGQLASLAGVPVIVSEYVRTDLNASAVYEALATKTAIYLVNRNAFAIGEKRRPTTQFLTERYAEMDQNALIATERIDFQPLFPIASNHAIELGRNVG